MTKGGKGKYKRVAGDGLVVEFAMQQQCNIKKWTGNKLESIKVCNDPLLLPGTSILLLQYTVYIYIYFSFKVTALFL